MTQPTIRLKVRRKSIVKGKALVRFPARVEANSPILLDNTGGIYSFGLDVDALLPSLTFTQSGVGAVTRDLQDKMRDIVAAEDFGAVGDGVTDDTTAIQNALNTGKRVKLLAKTYKITTLNMNVAGMQLVGQGGQFGYSKTTLTSSSTSATMIIASVSYLVIQGIRLTRTATAGGTAYGINFTTVSNFSVLDDLYIDNQYVGLALGSASFAFAQNIYCGNNLNDGLQLVNTGQNLQWQLFNISSQGNAGRGILVVNNAGSSASLGQWSKLSTFSNSGLGLAVIGTSGASAINGIRCSDSFFGEDGNSEIYLDTYGGLHTFTNVYVEGAGVSPTGPTHSTPASNTGWGLQVTANNTGFKFNGGNINTSSSGGATIAATTINEITATKFDTNFGWGIVAADGAKCVLNGNTFLSNSSGTVSYTTNASSVIAKGNSPVTVDNITGVANGGTGASTASGARTNLGLGTAATQNTGTSGANVPLLSTANTWTLSQTFTVAPVFTDASGSRAALGLGTAATQNTGTSGANVPLLNAANTWSGVQTFSSANVAVTGGLITLSGNAAPQVTFSPSSGATKQAQFFQTGDSFRVASQGVGVGFSMDLATFATILWGSVASTSTSTGTLTLNGTSAGIGITGAMYAGQEIKSVGATQGIGYGTGAGGAVTQITSRTTGVTLNTVTGAITLVSTAGSTTFQSFTLTNSAIAATDIVHVTQKSGTDKYQIWVTNTAVGSCQITFATISGTTTEQPVFNFAVIKGVTS
jgi:hypothetical protein